MRYIQNTVLKLPVAIKADNTEADAYLGLILQRLAESYTPREGLKLNIRELRVLNRVIDALEKERESRYIALETDEFDILYRVIGHMGTGLTRGLARNTPVFLDALDGALHKAPEEVASPLNLEPGPASNGTLQSPLKELLTKELLTKEEV